MKTEIDRVEELFTYWRKKGYPHYQLNNYDAFNELDKIIEYDTRDLIDGKHIQQTMHGLGFLWCFHPHWVEVNNILELWDDDDKLRTLCRKTIDWADKHEGGNVTVNRMRQNSKVYLAPQSPSNFRPTAAKYIYNTYGKQGVVYDPCAGWGGRLFGFLASNCERYIGTDPSKKSYNGLNEIARTFNKGILFDEFKDIEIYNQCAEDWIPMRKVDLVFTSPPYFDCEKYSDEPTQSYLRHPTREKWTEGFLREMIKGCKIIMKDDAKMILNIANTTKHKWIEEETIRVASEEGFELEDTLHLVLSSIAGKGVKTEPVFIFGQK
jgi:hypothetical protein